MTSAILALVIVLLAATQPSTVRKVAACSYAVIHAGHLAISPLLDGFAYFFSAAVADVVIMWLLLRASNFPAISISLLRVCFLEAFINALGWVLWYKYIEPTIYVTIFHVLNLWVVIILTRKDRADELGGRQVDSWADRLRLAIGSGLSTIPRRGT